MDRSTRVNEDKSNGSDFQRDQAAFKVRCVNHQRIRRHVGRIRWDDHGGPITSNGQKLDQR